MILRSLSPSIKTIKSVSNSNSCIKKYKNHLKFKKRTRFYTSNSNDPIQKIFKEFKPIVDKCVEEHLPREFDQETMRKFCGEPRYAYDTESATKSLLVPMWDILDRGGKRWRPLMVLLVAQAISGREDIINEKAIQSCAYLCEIVHNGTLAVDDIEDDSKKRRGKDCLHLIYGVDVAINAGNAMYFFPLLIFKELKKLGYDDAKINRAYELYSQEMINLHFGQGLDIWWHGGHRKPNVQEYLQMCAYKTGTLARLSAKLSALFAGGTDEQIEALGKFAEVIGVAFQIQDDLLNIEGDKFAEKIAVKGEDIHEGKRTLMVIHASENAPPEKVKRLEEILLSHPSDQETINEAIAILQEAGSCDYARGVAKDMVTKAWEDVESSLKDSPAKAKLKIFAEYLINRDF